MRRLKRMKKKLKRNYKPLFLILILIAFVFYFHYKPGKTEEIKEAVVREPFASGRYYPENEETLSSMIDEFFNAVPEQGIDGRVHGLVAPHAGYVASGLTAAYGFKTLADQDYETVIVIAPSHTTFIQGFSIADVTHYKTPLGLVELSPKVEGLKKEPLFISMPAAHTKEHSLEVELPFLQKTLKDFKLVPIVAGNIDPAALSKVLEKYVDDQTLIVASSDLSHYHPYEEANRLDKYCIDAIPSLDFNVMGDCEACGIIPVLTLMYIAQDLGWKGKLLDYRNSGDTLGDKSRVVGYASIAFYEEGLSEEDKKLLLSLARETLDTYLKDGKKPEVDGSKLGENLKQVQGCFVTLDSDGQLRGCIGHIIPQEELYNCVIDNAVNAAVNDHRFNPVTYEESKGLGIEVSVLTVPKKLSYDSPEDLLNKLRPMVDGVVIKSGWSQSTYLPQVWDAFPNKESFLSSLCMKGGAGSDCWRSTATEVYTYQANVFHETEFK